MKYATWVIVAFVTLLRGLAAWKVPLTGDEAYYWEWAKHLALGYADHPPMVAYLIFPFDWVTANPLWIRLGFLGCGVVATLAAAATAQRLTGDERAGMVTALAMTLTPMLSVGFVIATPDGPLMAGWALCLYLTVRASQTHALRDYLLLGVAIAFTLLSKMFAFALVAGIVAWSLAPARRSLWREGLGWSFGVAARPLRAVPVLECDPHWITFVFAFQQRHASQPTLLRPLVYLAANAGAYSPGLWLAALLVLVRPRNALIGVDLDPAERAADRAQPARADRAALDLRAVRLAVRGHGHRVRVALAPRARAVGHGRRGSGGRPDPVLVLGGRVSGPLYEQFRATGSSLRNDGPFEIFTYWPLAQDVRRMADANDAVVVTDGYGFSSQMDYEAGIPPVVIGYAKQGQEARRWYDAEMRPRRILFVDKEALVPIPGQPKTYPGRSDFDRRLHLACGRVKAGPDLEYSYTDPTGHSVPRARIS